MAFCRVQYQVIATVLACISRLSIKAASKVRHTMTNCNTYFRHQQCDHCPVDRTGDLPKHIAMLQGWWSWKQEMSRERSSNSQVTLQPDCDLKLVQPGDRSKR